MPISFNETPSTLRTPFVAVEFDNSQANQSTAAQAYRVLLIGQRLSAGTQAALDPVRVTSAAQAASLFGVGSMLARMFAALQDNDTMTESWAIALDDDEAGVQASGAIELSGTGAAGLLALYIGGQRLRIGVEAGMSLSALANLIAAEINAASELPVTASASGSTVACAAKHAGEAGNGIDLRHSYASDETLPAGLEVTVTPMSGGVGNPELSAIWAALGDEQYHLIVCPYTDAINLTALEGELADRSGPLRMIEGHVIAAAGGTHGELGALGDSRNSPHVTLVAASGSPTPAWEVAAAVTAVVAKHAQIDPARPFQTLAVSAVLAPHIADRFTLGERNLLLYDGISTLNVDAGGVVRIERLITTYTQNAAGADDPSYLDLNTLLTLSYLRWDFKNYIQQKYPRHKLADDGTQFGAGQAVMTPKLGAAEAMSRFRVWEELGLVENRAGFKAALIVERNAQDPNRLDWLLPVDLINQFRVGAAQVQFRI